MSNNTGKKEIYLDHYGKFSKRKKTFDVKFIIKRKLTPKQKDEIVKKYLEEHKYDHLLERW